MASAREVGEELSQLARFLFGRAANLWWGARFLELAAGAGAVIGGFVNAGEQPSLVIAGGIGLLLVVAYVLRLSFETKYDMAETMRRQSVLSEGLGWEVDSWQRSEWLRRAGRRLRRRLDRERREEGYYASLAQPGPLRLAEMTRESAFYTRNMYLKLRTLAWFGLTIVSVVTAALLVVSAGKAVPDTWALVFTKIVFLTVPVVLSVDFLGWALRLGRLSDQICEVERGLDHFLESGGPDEREVSRLVTEYNCQVVSGLPILGLFWSLWHDEFKELWEKREA